MALTNPLPTVERGPSVLKRATVTGVVCTALFLPTMYVLLHAYVVLTVSVGPVHTLNRLIDFALVAGGLTTFVAGFVSQVVFQAVLAESTR
ncbi:MULTISPECIES: hypothetical protein [unclassified Haloarcula]|uniref:hypothetical protein n=1 Tax=unclassified Haloarcula TaxID=2624677 RepID=UPI0005955257|nr:MULTISPECIES: hypothetical protein [unclassified Haloarcula]AJF25956.1 hypothetical protein SG26_09590 [Haloarcula sp. CBA1115]MUV51615.1 hypothetical protein [Haloarcula sp. CBA1122]